MAGFNDTTLGSQRIGFLNGGLKAEFGAIDSSMDVTNDFTIPTTLTNLLGWIGSADPSVGCVTLHARPITNMSLCAGPVLEISIPDISAGTAGAVLRYIVWGW